MELVVVVVAVVAVTMATGAVIGSSRMRPIIM